MSKAVLGFLAAKKSAPYLMVVLAVPFAGACDALAEFGGAGFPCAPAPETIPIKNAKVRRIASRWRLLSETPRVVFACSMQAIWRAF